MYHKKFIVIHKIPSARDLMSFNYFNDIPEGELLETFGTIGLYYKGFCICDIGSIWEKKYLKEVA